MAGGFRLLVRGGPDQGREVTCEAPAGEVRIGREGDPRRDLVCSDRKMSRRHATIESSPKGFVLTDRGSKNGTRHNGKRLPPEQPVALADGDELRFGDETVVRFELVRDEAPATRVVPPPSPPAGPENRGRTPPVPEHVPRPSELRPPPREPEPEPSPRPAPERRAEPPRVEPASPARPPEPERPTEEPVRTRPITARQPERPSSAEAPKTEPSRTATAGPQAPEPPRPPVPPPAPRKPAAEPPRPRVEAAPPREEFGPFEVYEKLAESDTDQVDVAVDTRSGERVALKRFDTKPARKAYKRIMEEAARGKRWHHPNIAEVVDFADRSGTVYVASRLIDGKSLSELQTRFAREIDISFATYVVREVCAGLGYAQREVSGFIHRNLNPRTIMVGYGGEVALINVGFVPLKVAADSTMVLDRNEARHLAPEHLAGRGLDARSDVFSIGVILYELLTQEPIDPRRKAVLPDVDTIRPEVPPALAKVTMRAVALRPEQRHPSAAEMGEELSEVLQRMAPGYGPEAAAWMTKRFPR